MAIILNKKNHTICLEKKGDIAQQQILLLDTSGSMNTEDGEYTDGKSRFDYAKHQTIALTKEASKIDPDGIDLISFGGRVSKFWNVTTNKVNDVFRHSPSGGTPTDQALREAYERHKALRSSSTQVLIITDGVPYDKNAVRRLIIQIAREVGSPEVFKIVFLTVGVLNNATISWLEELDDGLLKETGNVDIVGIEPLCGATFEAGFDS